MTDLFGKALDFTHGRKLTENFGILATLPTMYDKIHSNLNEILAEKQF